MVNNGLVIFKIVEIDDKKARCIVVSGGELSNRKSMNFPNRVMAQDFLSEKDQSDLLFGIENQVDFVAASFVSRKKDVADSCRFLDETVGRILISLPRSRTVPAWKTLKKSVRSQMVL